jgi:hypothetical protein
MKMGLKMQIKTIPSIYYTEPSEEIQLPCFSTSVIDDWIQVTNATFD